MTWKVGWDDRARRELRRLDETVQQRILRYLRERIVATDDPCRLGRALAGHLTGLWRYRRGDYGLICLIDEKTVSYRFSEWPIRKEAYR